MIFVEIHELNYVLPPKERDNIVIIIYIFILTVVIVAINVMDFVLLL